MDRPRVTDAADNRPTAARDADTGEVLRAENAELRRRLEEAEQTLEALRGGEVDALVIGDQLYTLEASDAALNRFLGDILAQVGDAVIAIDGNWRVTYLNAAAERQYDVVTGDVLGSPLDEVYTERWLDPGDEARARTEFERVGAWRGENIHHTRRGLEIHVETSLRRLADRSGRTIGRLAVIRDVSDRGRAEAALRAAHDSFRHLVQNSPFGVYTVDADFRLTQVSAGAHKVFENVRPLLGRDFAEVMHILWPDPFASEAIAQFRHTLATGEPYRSPSMVEHRDDIDTVEAYDWTVERVTLPDGRPGVVCYFYDLSERQRLEAALRDSAELLRQADQRKDVFLAMLAHELRSPLAPIRNAAEVLRRICGNSTPALRAADAIARQATHLSRLVDDLLDVSRVTQGKIRLLKEPVALADVVQAGIELARPLIDRQRHTLEVDLPADPMFVVADAARLTQVIDNLLNNAAKFTGSGGRIRLSLAKVGEQVSLIVQDTGVGIQPELLPRVFDLFTQGERSLDRSQGGLGLGLALVKHLVESHGGTIEAHSDGPGHGSRFTILMPLMRGEQVVAAAPAAAVSARRVLVVDDNVDSAESLRTLLELEGHAVVHAHDGPAALVAAAEFHPDACVLDIGLPGMDGYELARRLRGMPQAGSTTVIALSGYSRLDHDERAKAACFDHYLGKPVVLDTLLALLAPPSAD